MVTFQPDGPTSISYPLTDPELPGFTFFAMVIQRISFLNLDTLTRSWHDQVRG